ncbi:MAG: cyclic nucleotide-binding domain-containing protein [Candidatus Riflebacteria bacterium]|nr:cyclic nucleotide-binding domain-containing protein [Candidatus Riflebacteria bacterium]
MPDETETEDPVLEAQAVTFFETVQQATREGQKTCSAVFRSVRLDLALPPLGEGDRGMVYPLRGHSLPLAEGHGLLCAKVAKQQAICRRRLLEETMTTEFFLSESIAVPRIHYMDTDGFFCIKDRIEGESITSLYMRFNDLTVKTQQVLLEGLEAFLMRLLDSFRKRPDCKVSISPNNIYVLSEGGRFKDPPQFVLIDPGTTLKKNYSDFDFKKYWNEVLPDRIRKYQRTGYLQWLVPQEVTQSERDEASEFEIFRGLKPCEVFLLLKAGETLEFEPEDVILKEGAVGENFYLILDGTVEMRKGSYIKPGTRPLRLGRGAVLGEMAFLLHVPRSMTVVASTRCKLIEIDRDRFNELMDASLTAPFKLIRNIAVILAERLHSLTVTHQKLIAAEEAAGGPTIEGGNG